MDNLTRLLNLVFRVVFLLIIFSLALILSVALIIMFTFYWMIQKLRGKPISFNFQKMKQSYPGFRYPNHSRKQPPSDVEDATFYPSKRSADTPPKRLD